MKSKLIFCLCAFFALCFCGCQKAESEPPRVVTEISITRASDGQTHRYTNDRCMEKILNYLRTLDPYSRVSNLSEETGSTAYLITVTRSDGTQALYGQIHPSYFYGDSQYWKRIDPKKAGRPPLLFYALPPDQ